MVMVTKHWKIDCP